jgi:hypothetical protein
VRPGRPARTARRRARRRTAASRTGRDAASGAMRALLAWRAQGASRPLVRHLRGGPWSLSGHRPPRTSPPPAVRSSMRPFGKRGADRAGRRRTPPRPSRGVAPGRRDARTRPRTAASRPGAEAAEDAIAHHPARPTPAWRPMVALRLPAAPHLATASCPLLDAAVRQPPRRSRRPAPDATATEPRRPAPTPRRRTRGGGGDAPAARLASTRRITPLARHLRGGPWSLSGHRPPRTLATACRPLLDAAVRQARRRSRRPAPDATGQRAPRPTPPIAPAGAGRHRPASADVPRRRPPRATRVGSR